MKVDWKEIWNTNPNIFIVSGWEECSAEKRKGWRLPSQFSYYSAGDMNLRVGIIACEGVYKEEEFLLGGILWGSRLGNGARTVIYFVAQEFSPVFLGSMAKLGGSLSAKAVYWREKLTPSLYSVQGKDYSKSTIRVDPGELRPGWNYWERQLNPVAMNHLKIINNYFDGLMKRRVRTIYGKNKIIYCWGNVEIAELKKKGNKFELATKVKWTRNKSIATKFIKSGWVDFAGIINDEFCRAVNGILELLENMESNGSLDSKDSLAIKLINDKEFIPGFFGKHIEFPWIPRERNDILDTGNLYYFSGNNLIKVINPILEKPIQRVVSTLLSYTILENCYFRENGLPHSNKYEWNKKIYLLSEPAIMEELRLCQSWLKQEENFPIILLPEDWGTEGFKSLRNLTFYDFEELFY